MQVKLSGAGKWPYFTSACRNPLFQNTPNFVRGSAHVNKLKDRRNFSLSWKGMVGNFSIGKKKCESWFVS